MTTVWYLRLGNQKKCWLEDVTKSSISNKEKLARGSLRGRIMEASEPLNQDFMNVFCETQRSSTFLFNDQSPKSPVLITAKFIKFL